VPVGRSLLDDDPIGEFFARDSRAGSIIGVVATDAPLLPPQCEALARRVPLGIARTGGTGSHFSGDLFVALSVADPGGIVPGYKALGGTVERRYSTMHYVPWGALDPFFEAVVHATEEAVINALVANAEMVGFRGHRSPGLPRDRVVALLKERGVIG
jgi:L-aminopeptidase/D-esterase-like protein